MARRLVSNLLVRNLHRYGIDPVARAAGERQGRFKGGKPNERRRQRERALVRHFLPLIRVQLSRDYGIRVQGTRGVDQLPGVEPLEG